MTDDANNEMEKREQRRAYLWSSMTQRELNRYEILEAMRMGRMLAVPSQRSGDMWISTGYNAADVDHEISRALLFQICLKTRSGL